MTMPVSTPIRPAYSQLTSSANAVDAITSSISVALRRGAARAADRPGTSITKFHDKKRGPFGRDPPHLVFREQLGSRSPARSDICRTIDRIIADKSVRALQPYDLVSVGLVKLHLICARSAVVTPRMRKPLVAVKKHLKTFNVSGHNLEGNF